MKSRKIALFGVIMVVFAGSAVFPQTLPSSLKDLSDSVDGFSTKLALSLPFNSSMGLNWSDAYVGDFPKFGVGLSLGFTTMDVGSFEDLLKQFNFSLPSWVFGFGGFPIPGWTVEGRVGGLIPKVPFDMGFKFGILPLKNLGGDLTKFDYFMIGGDVRYAIIKGNIILPTLSVGMGFNYQSGALGVKAGSDTKLSYTYVDNGNPATGTLTLGAPTITLPWGTATLDFKAQISKSFFFITPYLGIGASTGWSKAGYEVSTTVTDSADNLERAKGIAKEFGIADLSATGFSSIIEINKWSGRLYGGLSFNAALLRIDLTALWNFADNRYGVSIGGRIQI
jgi:opacity protein-like surface antigen